jgi:hypothetical protein
MNDMNKKDDFTDLCDYPYIGVGNKPCTKNKKRILTEDEIERMTY